MKSDVDARYGVTSNVDFAHPGMCKNCEVWSLFFATQERVNISHRSAASTAFIRIICDREESDSLFQVAILPYLLVEVVNDGNVKSSGAGFNPVFADLIPVP